MLSRFFYRTMYRAEQRVTAQMRHQIAVYKAENRVLREQLTALNRGIGDMLAEFAKQRLTDEAKQAHRSD